MDQENDNGEDEIEVFRWEREEWKTQNLRKIRNAYRANWEYFRTKFKFNKRYKL